MAFICEIIRILTGAASSPRMNAGAPAAQFIVNSYNILYLIHGLVRGGTERHLVEVLKNLRICRFNPLVISRAPGPLIKEIESLGVNVKIIPKTPFYNVGLILFNFFHLIREIKKARIDIAHIYIGWTHLLEVLAIKLSGVKIVITTRRGLIFESNYFRYLIRRITNRFVDKIIANSKWIESIIRQKERLKGDKITTIGSGIDIEKFSLKFDLDKKRESLHLSSDDKVVGMVAGFRPVKRHCDFLDAAKLILESLPDTRFLLIGDGPERGKIEQQIKKLGIVDKVTLLGYRDDVNELLPLLDVSVICSLHEANSMAIIESMIAGVPVVATKTGGSTETVQDGKTGFLVNIRSPEELAEKILQILKNKKLANDMGREAHKVAVEKYSAEEMVRNMENLYFSLMRGKT